MRKLSHEDETLLFDALNNIPSLGWSERRTIYRAAQEIPGAWTTAKNIDLGKDRAGHIVTLGMLVHYYQILAGLQVATSITGSDLTRHTYPKSDH